MIRINENLKRTVVGTSITSLILSSCSVAPIADGVADSAAHTNLLKTKIKQTTNDNVNTTPDYTGMIVPMEVQINDTDREYILAIQALATDVVENKALAQRLVSSPATVLAEYGYTGNLDIDDAMLELVKVFADDDINQAIRNEDLTSFLQLCKQKGLIDKTTYLLTDQPTLEKLHQIANNVGLDNVVGQANGPEGVFGMVFVVLTVYVVVVMATAIEVALAIHFSISTRGKQWAHRHETPVQIQSILEAHAGLVDAFVLENGDDDLITAGDIASEDLANKCADFVREYRPTYFQHNSEQKFKNYIKHNYFCYLCQ